MTAVIPTPEAPCTTVPGVVARMQSIGHVLPPGDGVACFNRMYLEVTEGVEQHLQQGVFADPNFVSHLDVVFANRYFAAVDALSGPSSAIPAAWQPLLMARGDTGIEPIQFALAGMNAHINCDLPQAVVETCRDLSTAPTEDPHHADYQKIDGLLDAEEQAIRESFEPSDVRGLDAHVSAVTNLVGNWSINTARDIAWDTGLALWEVRDHPDATRLLTVALARTAAMATRTLLVAV